MNTDLNQRQTVAGIVLVIVVYILIALQSIHAPIFPWDDPGQFIHIRAMESWREWLGCDAFGFYRPVKNLFFVAFDALPSIVMARLLAIVTGIMAIFAVFGALQRLTVNKRTALFATAVWAWSPTLVSSTTWLSAVNIMGMTAFACGAIICHDQATRAKGSKMLFCAVLAIACSALALLSYEGAVCLIPLLLAIDFFLHPSRLTTVRNIPLYGAYLLLGCAHMFVRSSAGTTASIAGLFSKTSPLQAALAAGWFTVEHLLAWIWPFGRFAISGGYYQGMVPNVLLLGAWGFVLILAAGALFIRKRKPLLGLAIIWFLLGFAPMSNLAGFRNGPWGDYYITFASIGLALVLATIVAYLLTEARQQADKSMRILALAAALVLLRAGAIPESVSWSRTWNHPVEVFKRTVSTFPHAWGVWIELAKIVLEENQRELARQFAEQAATLAPDQHQHLPVLTLVSLQDADYTAAEAFTRRYLSAFPENPWALGMLGYIAETARGDKATAEIFYNQVLGKASWSVDTIFAAKRLAVIHLESNQPDKAIAIWKRILQIAPDDRETIQNLAVASREKGMPDKADRQ